MRCSEQERHLLLWLRSQLEEVPPAELAVLTHSNRIKRPTKALRIQSSHERVHPRRFGPQADNNAVKEWGVDVHKGFLPAWVGFLRAQEWAAGHGLGKEDLEELWEHEQSWTGC